MKAITDGSGDVHFNVQLLQLIIANTPIVVGATNILRGKPADEHRAEQIVQEVICNIALPHLPSPELIEENKQVATATGKPKRIPDILIKNVDGTNWAIIELKTLLKEDQLDAADVKADLQKLSEYQEQNPDALCLFMLVGSRSKLFNKQRQTAWSALSIKYGRRSFAERNSAPQKLDNDTHVAIPCGAYDVDNYDLVAYCWNIRKVEGKKPIFNRNYSFRTRMWQPDHLLLPN